MNQPDIWSLPSYYLKAHFFDINSIFIRYKLDINSIYQIEEISNIYRLYFGKNMNLVLFSFLFGSHEYRYREQIVPLLRVKDFCLCNLLLSHDGITGTYYLQLHRKPDNYLFAG
jgi:hypothetical protein